MSWVRLSVQDRYTTTVIDSAGAPVELVFLRMYATFQVGPRKLVRDGLIDTGAALTVFSDRLWRGFAHEIEWLSYPPGHVADPWWVTVSGLSGGSFPCRLGRFDIAVVDTERRSLVPVPVLAKFADDQGQLRRTLLGVSNGLFDGRRLLVEPTHRFAWLEERARAGVPVAGLFDA